MLFAHLDKENFDNWIAINSIKFNDFDTNGMHLISEIRSRIDIAVTID